MELPKLKMPNLIEKFTGAVKSVSDTATKGVSIVDQAVRIKNAIVNANVDETFTQYSNREDYEAAKKEGKKDILYIPDRSEKDLKQANALLVVAIKLYFGIIQAAAAEFHSPEK